MLEKPNLPDEKLTACLRDSFGLITAEVEFLPLGVDMGTAVYRAPARDGQVYFVKLRRGAFDETSVALPQWLHQQGIAQIIAPLPALDGRLWAEVDEFKMILYPFIEGRDGYTVQLTADQWREFGAVLRRIHASVLPADLRRRIQRETYTPQFRQFVETFLARVAAESYDDPVMEKTAAFMREKSVEIRGLIARAERLAAALQAEEREFVLCHSDLHAGNLLITAGGPFYIVDWDQPILAPKERDLMFIGGGHGLSEDGPAAEVALFYPGYGPEAVDLAALAYFRYDRIIQDIGAFCEQIFLTTPGSEDSAQGYLYLISNFEPGGTIEITRQADPGAE